jgi:uncharacterized protein (DUF362 family)
MAKAKVAVLKCTPETILTDLERLCELAGMKQALAAGKTTILKDNISWHYPFPGANTTPWQMEGTIKALRTAGYADITCVQNKTVVTNAFKGEDLNHYVPLFRKYDVPVLYNFKESDMRWVEYKPKARMHVLPRIFPDGIRIPDYFLGKNIVHLPTAKCHIYTTTTGAMKNAFGGLLATHRHYTHSWIHRTLVDLLAIQKEIHTGIFAIMDATTAGNGPGPRTMIPVIKNYILASADQVAIDAVSAKMMGFDPLSLEYISVAHEDGLGVGDRRRRHLTRELGLLGGRQPSQYGRRSYLVRPTQGHPEALLPHPAGQRVRGRQRGLPRLLPLAGQGQEDLRELEARYILGTPVPAVRERLSYLVRTEATEEAQPEERGKVWALRDPKPFSSSDLCASQCSL